MIAAIMFYGAAVGVLLVPAALCMDRTAALRRSARRWLWVSVLVVAVALPLVAPWRAGDPSLPDNSVPSRTTGREGSVTQAAGTLNLGSGVSAFEGALVSVDTWATTLWLVTSAGAALAYGVGHVLLARRRREWTRAIVLGRPVLLAADTGPAVVGLVSPVVVLPAWTERLETPALVLILRHEQEHVAARDPWLVHGAALATILMPWNPVVWWMAARLRLAVEFDCDARVLASRGDAPADVARYGELLLGIATGARAIIPVAAPGLIESSSSVSRRIAAMCAGPVRLSRAQATAGAVLAAAFVVAACNVPVPTTRSEEAAGQGLPPALVDSAGAPTAPSEPIGPAVAPAPAATSANLDAPNVTRETRPTPTSVVVRPGPGVVDPKVLSEVRPAYTASAMRRKVQGRVELEVVVGAEGKVMDARVVKPLDPDLDLQAVEAARRWTFEPGRRDGRPVAVAVHIVMSFTIH